MIPRPFVSIEAWVYAVERSACQALCVPLLGGAFGANHTLSHRAADQKRSASTQVTTKMVKLALSVPTVPPALACAFTTDTAAVSVVLHTNSIGRIVTGAYLLRPVFTSQVVTSARAITARSWFAIPNMG